MSCKVSVIVPAYNVEDYLYKCLKSIQEQSFAEIECLIVDNGSTDGTGKVIDIFCASDKRFKKVKRFLFNRGVSRARNIAIEAVKGEYIAFCDADDYVPYNAYEKLYQKAVTDHADVVVGNYYEFTDNTEGFFCNVVECKKNFVTFFNGGVIWNKLYRTEFLNHHGIRFRGYNMGEDTLFLGDVYIKSPYVSTEAEDVYHHLVRVNEGRTTQLSQQFNRKNLLEYFECGNIVYSMPYQCDKGELFTEYLRYLGFVYHFWSEIPSAKERKNCFLALQKFAQLFKPYTAEQKEALIKVFKIDPSFFFKASYEEYMLYLSNLSIKNEIANEKELLNQTQIQLNQVVEKFKDIENVVHWRSTRFENALAHCIPSTDLSFEFSVVEHCNLNCAGCDHFSPLAEKEFADVEEFERDMSRLSDIFNGRAKEIHLLGGEPLLHPDIIKFMEVARRSFPTAVVDITTNGLLLMNMSEEFWNKCQNLKIVIRPTKYPIPLDFKTIEMKAKNYHVEYRYINNTSVIKTMDHYKLDIDGLQNGTRNFLLCHRANTCINLSHGKLYTCTVAPNAYHFNVYFDRNLEVRTEDSIDIYKASSSSEIMDFLARPIPFCRYCMMDNIESNLPWRKSERKIEEWI